MKHHHTRKFGNYGETLAKWFLRAKGYSILATQFTLHHAGEVDIIAKKGNTLAFIEVKARPTLTLGLEAITRTKQQRIIKATNFYLAKHPQFAHFTIRFDVIVITPYALPHHLKHAFEAY